MSLGQNYTTRYADLSLDLDERRPRRRYGDLPANGVNASPNDPWNNWGKTTNNGGQPNTWNSPSNYAPNGTNGTQAATGEMGTTGAGINVPIVDPNAYQYGGKQGGAQAFNNQLQAANAKQQATQGAWIQNQYDSRDQSNVQNTLGGLGQFYQGQLNGTGPSLASAQMQQATDQSIAAQAAGAASARGTLGGALAARQAGMTAAGMEQNAAAQSMQGRIQEEYNAAQGMQGLGNAYEGEQQINANTAAQQAQLQQQQQDINARSGLGYAGLENQVNAEQLGAQEQQQAQMSGNYLAASGMGMNQSQFNTTQNTNLALGGLGAGLGLVAAFGDADFQEPGVGRGLGSNYVRRSYADADTSGQPAHLTLREEKSVDGRPFLAVADQNTGALAKVQMAPLTSAEHRQVMAPHGAGPLLAPMSQRAHRVAHDFDPTYGLGGRPGLDVSSGAGLAGASMGGGGGLGLGALAGGAVVNAAGGGLGAQAANAIGGGAAPAGTAAAKSTGPDFLQRAAHGAQQGLGSAYHPMGTPQYTPQTAESYRFGGLDAPFQDMDLRRGRRTHHADWEGGVGSGSGADVPTTPPTLPPSTGGGAAIRPLEAPPGTAPVGSIFPSGSDAIIQAPPAPEAPVSAPLVNRPDTVDPSTLRGLPPPKSASAQRAGGLGVGMLGGGGGPVKTSWQPNASPELLAQLKAGQSDEQAARADAAQAAEHAAEDAGIAAEKKRGTLEAQEAETKRVAAEHDEYIRGQLDKMDNLSRDAATMHLDSGRYFRNQTTMGRVRLALMGALGGFMGGFTHTPNQGVAQINEEVQRDLDDQRSEIEAKKGRVQDMRGILAETYRRFGNMDQAMAAAHAISLQKIQAEADAYAAGSNLESVKANNAIAQGQMKQDQARALIPLYRQVTTGGGAGGIDIKAVRKRAQEIADKSGGTVSVDDAFRRSLAEATTFGGSGVNIGYQSPGKGGDKLAAPGVALQSALDQMPKGAGEDFYDRNAPDFARSDSSLSQSASIATAARAYLKAIGGREPPPGSEGDRDAIRTAIGRPTPAAVANFRARASKIADQTAHAATPGVSDRDDEGGK